MVHVRQCEVATGWAARSRVSHQSLLSRQQTQFEHRGAHTSPPGLVPARTPFVLLTLVSYPHHSSLGDEAVREYWVVSSGRRSRRMLAVSWIVYVLRVCQLTVRSEV